MAPGGLGGAVGSRPCQGSPAEGWGQQAVQLSWEMPLELLDDCVIPELDGS